MWMNKRTTPDGLVHLAELTSRIMRMVLYRKIQQGDMQLRAAGVDSELSGAYKVHAVNQIKKSQRKRRSSVIIKSGRNDF